MTKTMKAEHIKTDGTIEHVMPQNGEVFTLEELQGFVGGRIDIQLLPKYGMEIVVNDTGKLNGLPKNENATEIWKRNYPIKDYPHNNDELVVGNVLICTRKQAGFTDEDDINESDNEGEQHSEPEDFSGATPGVER